MNKNKSQVQLEMEKLQIRRMTIYGEAVNSPQEIIYVLVKIFLNKSKWHFLIILLFYCPSLFNKCIILLAS